MKKKLEIISFVIAPFLGFFSFFLPVFITEKIDIPETGIYYILSLTQYIVEGMHFFPTMILLFICGSLLGGLGPRFWWLNALATVLWFPAIAVVEMFISPSSHNLWPIEFLSYGLCDIPVIAGSYVGSILIDLKSKQSF